MLYFFLPLRNRIDGSGRADHLSGRADHPAMTYLIITDFTESNMYPGECLARICHATASPDERTWLLSLRMENGMIHRMIQVRRITVINLNRVLTFRFVDYAPPRFCFTLKPRVFRMHVEPVTFHNVLTYCIPGNLLMVGENHQRHRGASHHVTARCTPRLCRVAGRSSRARLTTARPPSRSSFPLRPWTTSRL